MRKNIVLILCDQLRKDCIGGYGNEHVNTPNLDFAIENGVKFERCYVNNPICMPNRNSIISGRLPSNHNVWTNGILVESCGKNFTSEIKKAEYQTANIGKMHLNPCKAESGGISFESNASWDGVPEKEYCDNGYFGYDHIELTIGHTEPKAHYYKWFKEHGGTDDMFDIIDFESGEPKKLHDDLTGVRKMPAALCSSEFVGERGANYIKEFASGDKPFMMTASFPDPHHPFCSCPEDFEKYKGNAYQKPTGSSEDLNCRPIHYSQMEKSQWSRKGVNENAVKKEVSQNLADARVWHTYAMIERIDKNVGKIIQAAKDKGIYDDTVFIFTSDHGELLGDHGLWKKGPFFFEGLINVPLIVFGGGIKKGSCEKLVSSMDIAPTICELAGVEIPEFMDGVSFAKNLQGGNNCETRESCLVEYRNGYGDKDVNVNVIITENYKYARYENGGEELTDLKADSGEFKNVASDKAYAGVRQEMIEKMLDAKLKGKSKGDTQYGLA